MTQTVPGFDRLTVEPGKMGGQPCIRGYRFTAEHLVELHVNGWDDERVIEAFPFIEPEDIRQALGYALSLIQREIYIPQAESA
ncbi:DUF433 domain-containing protein [Sphaerimonospora cavernae]|uniref:DUF433 domain-containing protein n=1 Tax=Sphaerimonospora cavernae TaxID=1740611 RepID=A0ABV6U4W0_9ACTN